MANSRGSEAKSRSRRCFTLVSVTTPAEARTPLPTKFAVAEKHIGVDFSLAHFTPVVAEHKTLLALTPSSLFYTPFVILRPAVCAGRRTSVLSARATDAWQGVLSFLF